MADFCTVERDGGLLVVTMNRPEKLNAFQADAHEQMAAIFNAFEDDDALRVAILTGAGRAFCAGSDISCYVDGTSRPLPPEGGAGITHNRRLSKPIIAAVNGLAMGGGCEVALACDLIVAAEDAAFALPEPRVGAAALGGGLVQLCRKLPFSVAMSLILTGDRLSAVEAHRFGLVSELSPAGKVLETARALATRILAGAPLAIRATRAIARAALEGKPSDEIDRIEATLRADLMASADFTEGMTAFMEKRAPSWQGR
ncbi:enoyl-CoA hydratase-related protein [Sphingosinicella terrae]|uniref:enoyl-CoA hydratase-related protein n=1 Tax=Sphingosinicella terrae TaxID=2172047 RepID=UPI002548DCED|nr:enoyl-CoA hydratase-related protein [Sphingosinicella terrae]